jgi:hypothetical protein
VSTSPSEPRAASGVAAPSRVRRVGRALAASLGWVVMVGLAATGLLLAEWWLLDEPPLRWWVWTGIVLAAIALVGAVVGWVRATGSPPQRARAALGSGMTWALLPLASLAVVLLGVTAVLVLLGVDV